MAVVFRCCETGFFIRIVVVVVALLVLLAGLVSGLPLGLTSMSLVDLEVLAKSGTPRDRNHASKILPALKQQHLLLCTLLICNAVAMEALPIFLDSLVTALGATLTSISLVLLFDYPQAVCSRHGLAIDAKVAPFVQILVWICFPVAYLISKAGKGGELTRDETTIITEALELSGKTVRDAMTLVSETFVIDINAKLDSNLMSLILENGHSRVPVYCQHPRNIIGLILVKNLLTIHPEDEVPVKNVTVLRIPRYFTLRKLMVSLTYCINMYIGYIPVCILNHVTVNNNALS